MKDFFKRVFRVVKVIAKFGIAHCPRWFLPILIFLAVAPIPGLFDEMIVLLFVIVPVIRYRDERKNLARSISEAFSNTSSEARASLAAGSEAWKS